MNMVAANKAIWYGLPVTYNGIEYIMTAIIKRKHPQKQAFIYQAELKDIVAKSSNIYADLDRVHLKGETDIGKS